MTSQNNEQALESAIEKCLSGSCQEELKEQGILSDIAAERVELYRSGNGYFIGSANDFNA